MSYIADDTAAIGAHLKALEAEKARARGEVPAVDAVYAAGGPATVEANINWTSIYGMAEANATPGTWLSSRRPPKMVETALFDSSSDRYPHEKIVRSLKLVEIDPSADYIVYAIDSA